MPAPIRAAPPLASTRLIAPSGAMVKADTDPAPLPVKPKRPFWVTTAQQGAPWCVETAPLTSAGGARAFPPRREDGGDPRRFRHEQIVAQAESEAEGRAAGRGRGREPARR